MTYPSQRKVDYVPDAAGRVQNVKNDTTGLVYATVGYTPASGIQTVTMPQITETLTWNDRGQVTQLAAGAPMKSPLLTLGLYPCMGSAVVACAGGNTGSLQSQTIAAPGLSVTQTYQYDGVNRLTAASEGSAWNQSYGYDGYGNRWVSPGGTGYTLSPFTPTVPRVSRQPHSIRSASAEPSWTRCMTSTTLKIMPRMKP